MYKIANNMYIDIIKLFEINMTWITGKTINYKPTNNHNTIEKSISNTTKCRGRKHLPKKQENRDAKMSET